VGMSETAETFILPRPQVAALDHVKDTARCSRDNVLQVVMISGSEQGGRTEQALEGSGQGSARRAVLCCPHTWP
jgi:hypothetical protein